MSTTRPFSAVHTCFLALGLLISVAGCGGDNDQEPDEGNVSQGVASATVTVTCPRLLNATWNQAAFGIVDLVTGQTGAIGAPFAGSSVPPSTRLDCGTTTATASPQILVHEVQFEPGTVPSACAAKVTFSGEGHFSGGVPPFAPFVFKSPRISAFATYNMRTGLCRLQVPVVGPTTLTAKVSQACKPSSSVGFSCPEFVQPVN